jgi:hypothetical protein
MKLHRERERERERKLGVVRYLRRGTDIFPSLNVRRQCPLVLVGVRLREGKALGSEKGKWF